MRKWFLVARAERLRRLGLVALALLLAAGLYWLSLGPDIDIPAATTAEVPTASSPGSARQPGAVREGPIASEPSGRRAPALRIAEGGRISIDAASLRDGEVLTLELALSDEAMGSEPLPVRVVSVDGRRIETTAAPAAGSGSALHLELEAEWLRPGRYMIQVTTVEKSPLQLRRYVIEVVDSQLADPGPAPTGDQRSGQQEP